MQPIPTNLNRRRTLAAATWLGIVGSFVLLVLPVFIGTLIEQRHFSTSQAGWIGSADLIGFALASVAAFRTVRKRSWKTITATGLVLIIAGDVSSFFVLDFTPLFLVRLFLSGFGAGLVIAVPYTLLGDTSNPERNTGIYFSFNVLAGAIGLYILPLIVARFGAPGMFALLALTGVSGLPVTYFWLPSSGRSTLDSENRSGHAANKAVLLILAGIAFFNFGLGGVWAFIERIGLESGFSGEAVGRILSITYLISIVGSSAAAWQADRFGYFRPYASGIAVLCLALVLLIVGDKGSTFIVALALVNFAWNYSLTYQFSAVFQHDGSGRMAVFIIMVQAFGLMLGPGVAGTLAASAGYDTALALGIACSIVSLAFFSRAHRS